MSRYYLRSATVDAFELGHDPMPSWFVEAMLDNKVCTTIVGKDGDRTKIDAVIKGRMHTAYAKDGDFIVRDGRDCRVYDPSIFELTFGKVVALGRLL